MTLPTLVKEYEFSYNNLGGRKTDATALESFQRTLFAIKQVLTGNGNGSFSQPMTVSRSCDASSAGPSDYWQDYTDLVWNATTFSWIVLRGGGTNNFEILISLQDDNPDDLGGVWISPSGSFTGGSTTARPTATDEDEVKVGNQNWFGVTVAHTAWVHCIMSTDGNVVRLFAYTGGVCLCAIFFDLVQDPAPGWDGQHYKIAMAAGSGSSLLSHTQLPDDAWTRAYIGGFSVTAQLGAMASDNGANYHPDYFNDMNRLRGVWEISDLFISSRYTAAAGLIGTPTDMWFGGRRAWYDGQVYYTPVSATPQFVQVEGMLIPHDGVSHVRTW